MKCLFTPDKGKMFVGLTLWHIAAGCCHYLSATLHLTPGGLCLCVCVRPCVLLSVSVCALARPLRAVFFFWAFLRMEMSKIAYFSLEFFITVEERTLLFFWFNPLRLLLHVCLVLSVRVRCMTRSLRLRRASFCIQPPTTDITSSLQSHSVFHSINFCPPP